MAAVSTPREQLVAALQPLVERCYTGHCWVKGKNGPRHIKEPLDMRKLSEHVTGGKAYGVCPIAPGMSTTRVALLDLDSHKGETTWFEMRAVADLVWMALEVEGYSPVVFRSSGGLGIHIFILWDEPQEAFAVREMLRDVLASCGYENGTGGVRKKEIEIFPKQNEVPVGGCGSMFVLPFTGKSELLHG